MRVPPIVRSVASRFPRGVANLRQPQIASATDYEVVRVASPAELTGACRGSPAPEPGRLLSQICRRDFLGTVGNPQKSMVCCPNSCNMEKAASRAADILI